MYVRAGNWSIEAVIKEFSMSFLKSTVIARTAAEANDIVVVHPDDNGDNSTTVSFADSNTELSCAHKLLVWVKSCNLMMASSAANNIRRAAPLH